MATKEDFLNNIANELGRARITAPVEKPVWRHQPQHAVLQGLSQDQLVEALQAQCAVGHTSVDVVSLAQLEETIDRILKQLQADSVIAADDRRNDEYGMTAYYEQLKNQMDVHIWKEAAGEENLRFAERARVGITFSDVTLAESGTVVLFMNEQMGRGISLLPHAHIAIVPKSTIVPRMTQAAQTVRGKLKEEGKVPSCVSFISGPSKSADIEMNLVVGVHGPVEVFYIVVDDK